MNTSEEARLEAEKDVDVVLQNSLRFMALVEDINTRLRELRELVKHTRLGNLDQVDRERWACIRELENLIKDMRT